MTPAREPNDHSQLKKISALVPPASLINPPPVVGAQNLVPGPKDDLWESGEGKLAVPN